jgi:hypothetical protein
MANFPILITGQQAATATAEPLANHAATQGDGFRVTLEALKANTQSVFYGPPGVTTATGKELAPGTQDVLYVSNIDMINVIAASTGASVSWSACAIG